MGREPAAMKWWGWGDEGMEFDMASRPALWEYARTELGLENDRPARRPVALDEIRLPQGLVNPAFECALRILLREDQIAGDKLSRLTHAFGKSCRDMWRVRRGIVPWAPDWVIFPESHAEVRAVIDLARRHDARVIPFGGGSNIAGCLEPIARDERGAASLDMRRMDRLLSLDKESCVARMEAGALGPRLEEQLNRQGFTLGHFPDSFLFSTLGGWVATRSAGMQSDRYGKIEDMVISIRMAAPAGDIETRAVPRASNGIDVNHLCIGSEGTLGVITEVTLRVHRTPARKSMRAYLFPNFETGIAAMLACQREETAPAMMRLNDPKKTALSSKFAKRQAGPRRLLAKALRQYVTRVRHWDAEEICLLLAGFEGSARRFPAERRAAETVFKRFGAIGLGEGPGRSFSEGKFDFPYLRDYLFERDILCDVSETATLWSNVTPLYRAAIGAVENAVKAEKTRGWIGCHVSHSYHAGASLYFTFAYVAADDGQMEQFFRIKKASLDAILESGGTLSHHHAVGYEHMPWLEKDVSAAGVTAMRALKSGLDPQNIMNPGRLTGGLEFERWAATGLPER